MKKCLFLIVGFLACYFIDKAQSIVHFTNDNLMIKYAVFEENNYRGISPESFFSVFLELDNSNQFIAIDTVYSPDSAYAYIKYVQTYNEYLVENTLVRLTIYNNSIIRFCGNYETINELPTINQYTHEDIISKYQSYYNDYEHTDGYIISTVITKDNFGNLCLCYKIHQISTNVLLYISTSDLSVIKEDLLSGAGFNATFFTQYNGVRQGFNTGVLWGSDSAFILRDYDAAIDILKVEPNVTDLSSCINTFYNNTSVWGQDTNGLYPNYMLDAYWSASEYVYYLRNRFNCPKEYFQRNYTNSGYYVCDTLTPIYIASNTFIDNTHWAQVLCESMFYSKDVPPQPISVYRNAIVIGSQGTTHNARSSIDEVVHEYAHIFSFQSWHPFFSNQPNHYIRDNRLAEACADIWAAIITHNVYPDDEDKIWKIGEDVVLPTSGHTCIRNLSNPTDTNAEIFMNENTCQEVSGQAYQQSGIISHWFYLLSHGFSDIGCDGTCYSFPALSIDSISKLLYYCERSHFFHDMEYSDIYQATLDAAEIFQNPEEMKISILQAWKVLGVEPENINGVEQFGLSYNSSNNSIYAINTDLIIDSLQTLLISGVLKISDSARIIVRPGGKLVVDGGTLTSACDAEMWPGITVLGHSGQRQLAQNQGSVELRNGAVIEHARCGITLGADEDDLLHTGGILSATDASFRNCARAVHFRPYMDSTAGVCCRANTSSCTRVTFVVDSGNRFAQNNISFGEHILLQDVIMVRFKACSLVNVGFIGNTQNCGIRALGASFCLSDDDDGSYPPNPNIIVHRSLVSGFHYGVHASGTAWRMGMGPGLLNTVFRNNIYGAHLHDCQSTVIERCSFHLDSLPYSFVRPVACGVYLSDSYGAEFEGDTFIRAYNVPSPVSRGIYASNNTMGDVIVYHNLFENLTYGIHAAGNNGDSTRGLLFSCNEFLYNNYGIYIPSSSTVAMRQKYRGYSAANSFTGVTNYGIYNAGPQNINYYNSTVGLDPSLIYGSVTQHYGAPSGGCFFSWDTILPIVDPEPIKTEGDSTADTPDMDPPKSLSLGVGTAGTGLDDVRIFPNPNNGQFSIHSSQSTIYRIRLYDVYGKLLKTVNVNASMAEFDVHELCAGVYVLRVETDSGAVVKRVVKE